MDYLPTLATMAGVFLLGCLSPGPNFLVVTSRAMAVSRRADVFAGLGVAAASLTWASLTIAGLTFVLQHAAWLFTALRLVSASYLLYLGTTTIIGAHRPVPPPDAGQAPPSASNDAWSGFLTSMTNSKAVAFFGSLFVVTLPTGAPAWVLARRWPRWRCCRPPGIAAWPCSSRSALSRAHSGAPRRRSAPSRAGC